MSEPTTTPSEWYETHGFTTVLYKDHGKERGLEFEAWYDRATRTNYLRINGNPPKRYACTAAQFVERAAVVMAEFGIPPEQFHEAPEAWPDILLAVMECFPVESFDTLPQ